MLDACYEFGLNLYSMKFRVVFSGRRIIMQLGLTKRLK